MIFQLMARMGLDSTDFKLGVKQAESAFGAFSKRVSGMLKSQIGGGFASIGASLAGMFTVGAAVNWVKSVSDAVGEIKDMADLLEISTDEVQQLQKAAAGSGQSFEAVAMAMQRIQQLRAQAEAGDKGASGLFAILGIDPSKGSAADIIKQALSASSRGVAENAAAFDLLGKKAASLRLVFDELQQQGPIKLISEEELDRIDQASKRLENALYDLKVASAPFIASAAETAAAAISDPALVAREYAASVFPLATMNPIARMLGLGGLNAQDLLPSDRTAGGVSLGALDLQAALRRREGVSSVQTSEAALQRIAAANEATLKLLQDRTQ